MPYKEWRVEVRHVYREINGVADKLAGMAVKLHDLALPSRRRAGERPESEWPAIYGQGRGLLTNTNSL